MKIIKLLSVDVVAMPGFVVGNDGSSTLAAQLCIVLYFYSASIITNTTVKNKIKCDATELVRSPRVAFT